MLFAYDCNNEQGFYEHSFDEEERKEVGRFDGKVESLLQWRS